MAQKSYFYVGSQDYEPDRSIRLGQIIASADTPWERVAGPIDIPGSQIEHCVKTDWRTEVNLANGGRLGVWAQWLAQFFGVGADSWFNWMKESQELFEFDELETFFFQPEEKYVAASVLEREDVVDWMKKNSKKSIFMVRI
jgi:hypothetical protein